MKFCPTCQTRYDEEILRFCTKDGTPLVDEDAPQFTALPSETSVDEDEGEETVIRRNPPSSLVEAPPVVPISEPQTAQRIVIPTTEVQRKEPVRARVPTVIVAPRKSNTAKTVMLTLLGTFTVLAIIGIFWMAFRDKRPASADANKNINVNFNSFALNSNLNGNFNGEIPAANFNASPLININSNLNANLKTPTPTRTPTPKPTPSATPNSNANANTETNVSPPNSNATPKPTATPTPSATPKPTPVPPQNVNVNVGIMNSRAVSLPKPAYPDIAKQARAAGQVTVQISVDEEGNVVSVKAISGHPLLRPPAEFAARQSRFNPVRVGDHNVRATGLLVYNFINQ